MATAGFDPLRLVRCRGRGAQRAGATRKHRRLGGARRGGARAGRAHSHRTQAEYGAGSAAFDEGDPPAPQTLYGVAKLAVAGAFAALGRQYDARVVWGRVFSLYGPGQSETWLVASLIGALMRGEAPALTPCEQLWEFTHVRDAARGFVALMETPGAAGLFNVASGQATPLREAVLMLRDLVAPQIEPQFGRVPYRPDQVMRLEARIDRIRAATGWVPRIGLRDGFAETVAAFARERAAA
jgi:UDP-glucose 4-epimerase